MAWKFIKIASDASANQTSQSVMGFSPANTSVVKGLTDPLQKAAAQARRQPGDPELDQVMPERLRARPLQASSRWAGAASSRPSRRLARAREVREVEPTALGVVSGDSVAAAGALTGGSAPAAASKPHRRRRHGVGLVYAAAGDRPRRRLHRLSAGERRLPLVHAVGRPRARRSGSACTTSRSLLHDPIFWHRDPQQRDVRDLGADRGRRRAACSPT